MNVDMTMMLYLSDDRLIRTIFVMLVSLSPFIWVLYCIFTEKNKG